MTDDVTSFQKDDVPTDGSVGEVSSATDRLLSVLKDFGGEALRDVWLFDQWTHERVYAREDVAESLDGVDPEGFIDNERYGFVTKDTYEELFADNYSYTVRGFREFEQFRAFIQGNDDRVGIFAGFDRREGGYDFSELYSRIQDVTAEYPIEEFTPAGDFE